MSKRSSSSGSGKRPWARVENAIRRRPWQKCERDLLDALKARYQGQARIYCGDRKLAGRGGRPWVAGANNRCAPISIWRAKRRLEAARILAVTHTSGGYTRNPKNELVRAATGYEPHPDLYLEAAPQRVRRRGQEGPRPNSPEAIAAGAPVREPLNVVWARIAARKVVGEPRDGP